MINLDHRPNFHETLELLNTLGTSLYTLNLTDGDHDIEIRVWDPIEGEVVLESLKIDSFKADRLFGNLFVYSIDPMNGYMSFTLLPPDRTED